MTKQEQWAAVFRVLGAACAELEAMGWPAGYQRRRPAHITGYSRERGRRAIVKEAGR